MYFFAYLCCMKKNGIMHDILSFPSDEEDAAPGCADFIIFFFVLLHMGQLLL